MTYSGVNLRMKSPNHYSFAQQISCDKKREVIANLLHTWGIASLLNINAWNNCAVERGMSSQLPNHHGRFLNQPFSSNALYTNSRLLVAVYMAAVMRSWPWGYAPSKKPAKLAPMAGEYLDVSTFAILGFRSRKGRASSVRKWARKRAKKRYNSR